MQENRELNQISREFASVARELGSLSEAVSGLKDDVRGLDTKFDKHLEGYTTLQYKIGKLAGSVAFIISLLFAGAKEAFARLFS